MSLNYIYIYIYIYIYTLTYLLTPWCRVLLEKLTGLQLVKKFPAFHGTRRFTTALTSVRQLSISWASPIQSIYPHPLSWRSILILSTHLRLVLPSGFLPSGFPSKTLYTPPLLTHTRHMPSPIYIYIYIYIVNYKIKFESFRKNHTPPPHHRPSVINNTLYCCPIIFHIVILVIKVH